MFSCKKNDPKLYLDANAPIKDRMENLLSQMTLEEKVGQMNQFVGLEHIRQNSQSMSEEELYRNTASGFYPGYSLADIEQMIKDGKVGSFLHVLTLEEANHLQELSLQSRLGIPCLIGIDAIHGNAKCLDNTVYPTHIGLACSFDTAIAEQIGRQTALEMRAMNMHWTFDPNVEVARDPRWGRVGETFGEDPLLVSLMGERTTIGLQGNLYQPILADAMADTMADTTAVLACVKHFVGGSEPLNGTNGAPADLSERTLRTVFFPSFKANISAGVATLMPSHNELNGTPCHSNKWLLQDIARQEWGFSGFVISDWMDLEHIADLHHTAEDNKEAFRQAILAGVDMHMHGPEWNKAVCELVREGKISEKRIDESVRRILTTKFLLGLFEHPYSTAEKRDAVCFSTEHQQTAIQATRESIVLLKNDGLLPLDKGKYKHIMLTGINADDENIMGDWSEPQRKENLWTVLRGIKEEFSDAEINFIDQGWDPRNMNPEQVKKAAEAAKKADLNIVVAGEYMMRRRWTERTGGEDTDRSNIDLVGLQEELIEAVYASGKPTILILINGRQLGVHWANEHLPAIIEAWEPGQFGGKVLAEILVGKTNPSAKLAITIPRTVGQVQMVYNHLPSAYFHPYAAYESSEPLWHFGYGLSYSTFEYSNLQINTVSDNKIQVCCDIKNTSAVDGTEIAQLYIRDCVSSLTRPVKELKGFKRIPLKAGETKTVQFELTKDDLSFIGADMKPVFESGDFEIMVGASSRNEDIIKQIIRL